MSHDIIGQKAQGKVYQTLLHARGWGLGTRLAKNEKAWPAWFAKSRAPYLGGTGSRARADLEIYEWWGYPFRSRNVVKLHTFQSAVIRSNRDMNNS